MDNWNDVLQRMRSHTPWTPEQVQSRIAKEEAEREAFERLTRSRIRRLHAAAWIALAVAITCIFAVGNVLGILVGSLVLLFFGIATKLSRDIQDARDLVDAVKHWHSPPSSKEVSEIADLSQRSPEFAKIVNGWLEVGGTLSWLEVGKVGYNATEAFERHLAEQRIRSSSNGVEPTDKAA